MQREVGCNGSILQTAYDYNDANDALLSETVTEPSAAIPHQRRYIYAYATSGSVRYTMAGHDGYLGRFKAFCMGLPAEWLHHAFIAVLILVPVTFFTPAMVHLFGKRNGKRRRKRRCVIRLSLFGRCIAVMLAYMMFIGPWTAPLCIISTPIWISLRKSPPTPTAAIPA